MKTLNAKMLVATFAAAAAMTAVAAPAMAQPHGYDRDRDARYGNRHYDDRRQDDRPQYDRRQYDRRQYDRHWKQGRENLNQQQARIEQTIRIGARRGDLTRNEVRVLSGISHDIARLEVRYRSGGLSNWERQDLSRRLDRLERAVHLNLRDYQISRR